jgi:8-oxo-dGTP pyrophosphatase MutT (NUDIX family)
VVAETRWRRRPICDNEPMGGPERLSARVIVVDDEGCVLLVRVVDNLDDKPPLWITPGGGLEGDESLPEAAARELREETGLTVTPGRLGRPLAVSRGEWVHRGTPLRSEDWYFGLRTPRFVPTIDGYTDLEQEVHEGWRWWTPAELEAPSEVVIPRDLHEVVGLILQQRDLGRSPVVLPWTAV